MKIEHLKDEHRTSSVQRPMMNERQIQNKL